jgi:hypothetical protein
MVTVAAEVRPVHKLLLKSIRFSFCVDKRFVLGWLYQELHGVCGSSNSGQIIAGEQRRSSGDDKADVR